MGRTTATSNIRRSTARRRAPRWASSSASRSAAAAGRPSPDRPGARSHAPRPGRARLKEPPSPLPASTGRRHRSRTAVSAAPSTSAKPSEGSATARAAGEEVAHLLRLVDQRARLGAVQDPGAVERVLEERQRGARRHEDRDVARPQRPPRARPSLRVGPSTTSVVQPSSSAVTIARATSAASRARSSPRCGLSRAPRRRAP